MDNAITHNSLGFSVGPVMHTFKYALVNGKPKKNFSIAVLEYIFTKRKNKIRELYTSLHHQQHIVFMRISKKTISVLEVAFSILIVVPF